MVVQQKKWALEELFLKLNKPKMENKAIFFKLLAVTQNAWLWIRDALITIRKAEPHPGMQVILKNVIKQINEWESLSEALVNSSDIFSISEIELIRSAEQMGKLPEILENLAEELEKSEILKKKIRSAMMYPMVVISVAIIAVIILLVQVIPNIIKVFPPGVELPWITKFVIASSDYIQNNYMKIIIFLISLPIIFSIIYKKVLPFKIYVDKAILKVPVIWQMVKLFYRYKFSKIMSDSFESWLSPIVALEQISRIFQNYHYRKKVQDVKKDIELWLEMAESFEWSWLFNPILIQILWIWEESGNIWEVLWKMANFYREELDVKLEWITKVIEPILMVFVAWVIWTIVAAIFLPMVTLIWALSK